MTISSESRLGRVWQSLGEGRKTALIPFLTAGFPDRDTTINALRTAARFADVIEVGVPFSEPVADGPTIQAASFASLRKGTTLAGTLEMIEAADLTIPVVLFSYLNPVLQYGVAGLIERAEAIGVAGILVTDLPVGADPELEAQLDHSSVDRIRMVAPTTRGRRLAEVVDGAKGFLYVVARLGVTGAQKELAAGLAAQVERVRTVSQIPIAVGFGISTGEQAREVARIADGVVVGSRAVAALAEGGIAGLEALLTELRTAMDRP